MFRNLIEKSKKFQLKKKFKNIYFFLFAPILLLSKNVLITFVPQINFLHNIHSHVCYEKAYQHKKFQKFNIETLITIELFAKSYQKL